MNRNLKITINCGETTCASEPGKFCRYMGTKYFGTQFICMLFPDGYEFTFLFDDKNGWLQRCKACLDAEKA